MTTQRNVELPGPPPGAVAGGPGRKLIAAIGIDHYQHWQRSGDRTTTGSGLGSYLQRRVDAHTKSKQTPDFGYFLHDNRGELAIPLATDDPPPEPAAYDDYALELASSEDAAKATHIPEAPLDAVASRLGSAATHAAAAARGPRNLRSDMPSTPRMSPYARRAHDESSAEAHHPRDLSRWAPLGAMELSDLIHRLESAVEADGQSMTMFAVIALLVAVVAIFIGVDTPSWFGLGLGTCALFAAFVALSWRATVPPRMRRVIKAVRDTPDKITVLVHSSRNTWIEIRTSENRLVVQAKHDRAALFATLIRRCRSARVRYCHSG